MTVGELSERRCGGERRVLRCAVLLVMAMLAACDGLAPDPDGGMAAPYALFAVQPAVAGVGDVIALEGTFGDSAIVSFPGGGSFTASVIGPHRVTIVVPPGTTAGDLQVSTTNGSIAGRLAFHGVSFPLGLGNAEANLEQAEIARPMPSLAIARHDHASVVIGRHVYAIGGGNELSDALDSVERAAAGADGSLGPFSVLPGAALATGRSGHTAAVLGGYLYVIGGHGERSVERAAIHGDGSLGPFATVEGVALSVARGAHASAVIGNQLYVIGGQSSDGALASVERATIATDGSLGPFTVLPGTALTVGRYGASVTVIADHLYVVGGNDGNSGLNTIERAPITSDGSLGPFSRIDATLSTGRHGHTAILLGNALYVQGGVTAAPAPGIERSFLAATGSLGAFTTAPRSAMATARTGHTNASVGDHVYTLGGKTTAAGGALRAVERATINGGGAITTFGIFAGATLQVGSDSHTSAVIGDHLYVIGGEDNTGARLSRIERADIAGDGSPGPFAGLASPSLSAHRYLHACAIAGDHVYLIGGRSTAVGTPEIDESLVGADDALGFIEPAAVALQTARYGHTAVAIGDHLYILGGASSVERADIAAGGSLGRFATVSDVGVSVARSGHTSVVLGNFLYNVGGTSGSTFLNTVQRAAINAAGSLGPFADVPNLLLSKARAYHASIVVGNYLYVLGGQDSTGALASVERSAIAADGSLGPFAATSVTLATGRIGPTVVALAGHIYVLGGRGPAGVLTSVERAALAPGGGL
jgi:N-acetylneuraminic acid mutarotase